METSDLKTTPTQSPGKAPVRKHFDFARLLVLRDRLPWFWFLFTIAVLLLSAIDRYHIVSQFKQRERVVIIDPAGTYYLSPLLQFSEAKDLHVQQAELATLCFLERSPKDFDERIVGLGFCPPKVNAGPGRRPKGNIWPNHHAWLI